MRFKRIDEIVGKRIAHVEVKEHAKQPKGQVIIVFDDGEWYEFYSQQGDLNGSPSLNGGGLGVALSYMSEGATRTDQFPEPNQ